MRVHGPIFSEARACAHTSMRRVFVAFESNDIAGWIYYCIIVLPFSIRFRFCFQFSLTIHVCAYDCVCVCVWMCIFYLVCTVYYFEIIRPTFFCCRSLRGVFSLYLSAYRCFFFLQPIVWHYFQFPSCISFYGHITVQPNALRSFASKQCLWQWHQCNVYMRGRNSCLSAFNWMNHSRSMHWITLVVKAFHLLMFGFCFH